MVDRPSRLYLITKPAGKDILVFDMGHEGGSVYVYELRGFYPVDQVKDEYRKLVSSTNPNAINADLVDPVEVWVEMNYGSPLAFDVKETSNRNFPAP